MASKEVSNNPEGKRQRVAATFTKESIDNNIASASASEPLPLLPPLPSPSSKECAICLESNETVGAHGCKQCRADAWTVCENCDALLLSRVCPLCKGDYRPLQLTSLSKIIFQAVRTIEREGEDSGSSHSSTDSPPAISEECLLRVMTERRLQSIALSNVMIYTPEDSMLQFSLPVDMTVGPKEARYLRGSKRASDEELETLKEGTYSFGNQVWEALILDSERDEEGEEEYEVAEEGEGGDTVSGQQEVTEEEQEEGLMNGDDHRAADASSSAVSVENNEPRTDQELLNEEEDHVGEEFEVEESGNNEGNNNNPAEEEDDASLGIRETFQWVLLELAKPGADLFVPYQPEMMEEVVQSLRNAAARV